MPCRSYCGELHPLTRNHAKGEIMATFIVELVFRVEVNSPDAGSATNAVRNQVEYLKGAAEQIKYIGYQKPVVEVKSWEKGG